MLSASESWCQFCPHFQIVAPPNGHGFLGQMASLRTQAESLARCLETGLTDVADAVRWADRQIQLSDSPCGALCDVSMASSKFPQDVAHMLRSLPGDPDHQEAILLVLRRALVVLHEGSASAEVIARALFELAFAGDLPEGQLKDESWWYWDSLDLARDGLVA